MNYPLAWLDEIVEVTLNPVKNNVAVLEAAELELICAQCAAETRQVEVALKAQIFPLSSKTEKQTVIEHYEHALGALCRQAAMNLQAYASTGCERLLEAGQLLLTALEELHQRICQHYQAYLPQKAAEPWLPAMLIRLLIKMSGDQISIVARAAYQAGLIPAKSLREAFRLIAPHLATEKRANLSGESLRSHSGQPEKPDLDIVLGHLDKITAIIKGYYRRR